MPYSVRYKRAATAEIEVAISGYAQPALYQRVEGEIRRAVLRRFPYSLFYVIEQDQVIVLAFMHQHQKPRTREELIKP